MTDGLPFTSIEHPVKKMTTQGCRSCEKNELSLKETQARLKLCRSIMRSNGCGDKYPDANLELEDRKLSMIESNGGKAFLALQQQHYGLQLTKDIDIKWYRRVMKVIKWCRKLRSKIFKKKQGNDEFWFGDV